MEGTGRSLIAFSREAVVGNDVAHDSIIESNSEVDRVVGMSEVEG